MTPAAREQILAMIAEIKARVNRRAEARMHECNAAWWAVNDERTEERHDYPEAREPVRVIWQDGKPEIY